MKKLAALLHPWWAKVLVLFVVSGIGFWLWFNSQKAGNSTQQYQTSVVEKGTLVVAVSGSGSVSSSNNSNVTTALGGIIADIYVQDGAQVVAGTPLLKLTLDDDAKQKQAAAYANYLNAVNTSKQAEISKYLAQVSLEAARQSILSAADKVTELDKSLATDSINPATKEKYTQNEIDSIRSTLTQSRDNFAIAEQKYNTADTSIAAARSTLASAKLTYAQYSDVITAPVDGTVTNFTLQKGDRIELASSSSSNSNATTTQTVAVIKTTSKPSVTISVSEVDIPQVKIGNNATLTADAFSDKTYTGKVTAIDTVGASNSGIVSFPVTIVLDTDQNELYANMTVSANIITNTKADVLLVPTSAVQTQNGEKYVRVMRNGQISNVAVIVGSASDTQTEIVSGVAGGDEVVTSVIPTTTNMNNATRSVFSTGGFGGAMRIVR